MLEKLIASSGRNLIDFHGYRVEIERRHIVSVVLKSNIGRLANSCRP
jgi:hypothetical protein